MSSVLLPDLISPLLLHTKTVRVSPVSLEEIKFACIFISIFHSLDSFLIVLWSFIKSLKYGIILQRYCFTDSFLSLSSLLS